MMKEEGTDVLSGWEDKGRIVYLVSMAIAVLTALVLGLMPVERFIDEGFLIGDSLVYARVAYNIVHGHGSSYDLVTTTNGYHPLWLLMHVPFMLGAGSIMGRLFLLKLLWAGTALAASLVWGTYIHKKTDSYLAGGVMVLMTSAFGWSLFVLYSGIETSLVLLMLGLSLTWAEKMTDSGSYGSRQAALMGALLGLTFLSRLDSIFIAGLLGLAVLWRMRGRAASMVSMVASGLALSVPYLVWNYVTFDRVTPVSGIVKTAQSISIEGSLGQVSIFIRNMGRIGVDSRVLFVMVAVVGLAFAVYLYLNRRRLAGVFRLMWVVPAGAALQYTYYVLLITELHVSWHMYSQFLCAYIIIALVADSSLDWLGERRQWLAVAGLGVFLLGFAVLDAAYIKVKSVRSVEGRVSVDLGQWVAHNIPSDGRPDSRIVFYDSFFAAAAAPENVFIDANGLVGDMELAGVARINRSIPDPADKKDIAAMYGAGHVAYWAWGKCEVADPGAFEYVSPLIRTNMYKRLVLVRAETYREMGKYGALDCGG
jgi:hypothetical protein